MNQSLTGCSQGLRSKASHPIGIRSLGMEMGDVGRSFSPGATQPLMGRLLEKVSGLPPSPYFGKNQTLGLKNQVGSGIL
jgi:hypothetical protein